MRTNRLLVSVVFLFILGIPAGSVHAQIDPESIVGIWLFDEGGGDVAEDASGNGNDGTLNGPQWATESRFGGALEFNGAGSYIEFATGQDMKTPQFTIVAWFNTRKLNGYGHIFQTGKDWNDMAGYVFRVNQNGMPQAGLAFGAGNVTTFVTGPALEANTWYHLALTYDGTTATLYLDGENVSSNPGAGQGEIMYDDLAVRIGTHSDDTGSAFDGFLDEVALFDVALTAEDIQTIMASGLGEIAGGSVEAFDPLPDNGEIDVQRDGVLNWAPGMFAVTHTVYFGVNVDDVTEASTADPRDVLLAQGLTDTSFDPGRLAFGQTYYWRVDEVNAAPDLTEFKGDIWSFQVEPLSYPIETVTASASSAHAANMSPERTINGVGLNADDQHSVNGTDMWLSAMGDAQPWIQYEFDQAYKLHEMWVWNSNQVIESFIGLGAKDVIVETSVDGTEWTAVENVEPFAQASGSPDYTANTIVDLGGAYARFVRLTVTSGWGGLPQFGLSELRFFFIPTFAREPQPLDGSMLDRADVVLTWRAGREAASHQIYLGTDPGALVLADTTTANAYDTGALAYDTAYYWQVVEVNEAEVPSSYAGPIWGFSTPPFAIVDDFEQYDDDCDRIFFVWEDGLGHNGGQDIEGCDVPASNGNGGGSIVGNNQAPFAEKTIVNAGSRQSLPFEYDNAFGQSETMLRLNGQDWSVSEIQTLALALRGTAGNTGTLYVKINNVKIAYDLDPADIGRPAWQAWNIDLTGVSGLQNVQSLAIGVDGANAAGMLYIDDIRLYPLPGEMLAPTDPGNAGLVAHYALDGNASDSSGNAYHGVENGTPSYEAGVIGQALNLDGFASYITVDTVGIGSAAPRSIAGWAKANSSAMADWTNVFGFTGPSTNGQHFDIQIVGSTGTTTSGYFGLHRHGWEMDITANDQEWHHFAATFDGASVNLYGDGQLAGTAAADNVNTPGPVHMGKRADNDSSFEGLIDDVRIYDVALSPEEILWLAGRTEAIHKPF